MKPPHLLELLLVLGLVAAEHSVYITWAFRIPQLVSTTLTYGSE